VRPTVGSLFAGIGGFDLGFERAGFETAWQVEIDPWCRKVLAKNSPNAERFDDVRTVGAHNLSSVDVLVGGFPCQDISNAGLRAGIEGERSGLWGEFARIIGELRPRYVLVENVAALLGRGMGRVLGDLAEIGYDAEWEIVSAADVGAPHLRERVWILAYPMRSSGSAEYGEQQSQWAEIADSGSAGDVAYPKGERCRETGEFRHHESSQWATGSGEDVSYTDGEQYEGSSHADGWVPTEELSASLGGQWAVEPNVGRVAHGIPKRVDRLRGLGNAVVPQIPELYAHQIRELLKTER
jgi:DNA (cytosine-5)-methyltransferase 1